MKKRLLAWIMSITIVLGLAACGGGMQATELTAGIEPEVQQVELEPGQTELSAIYDFSLRLFQESVEAEESIMVSPLSALCAMAMTANGAGRETLAQMEEVFGLPLETLNESLSVYRNTLPQGETYRLDLANSIWLKEGLDVREDFLNSNVSWYDAEIYQAPFDKTTVEDINAWIEKKTNGLIPNALDRLSPTSVLCLVNALYFDADWWSIYQDFQVQEGVFTTEDGEQQEAEFMYCREGLYLEDPTATGFVKFYDDAAYAFVALLPNEGVALQDYIQSLTGEHLRDMLTAPQEVEVETKLPKFKTESSLELNEILQDMGMTDAFDPVLADFSAMAETETGMLYLDRVLQKTVITVDERGTEAGAVTIVEPADGAAMPQEEPKVVHLDRPFLYLIVDWKSGLPVFMGTLTETNP